MIAYNNFEKDVMALNDSCNAIACRQDLEPDPSLRYPFGAIDGKVITTTIQQRSKKRSI